MPWWPPLGVFLIDSYFLASKGSRPPFLSHNCWNTVAKLLSSALGKGHVVGGSAYSKAGSSLRKPPVSEHLPPKPESVLCSHLYLWLHGGLSPITISLGEGVNLQLQVIKIPGRDKSVSTYKLLWSFSSLPEWVCPATCDCLQPPNRERHEMLLNFLNTESFEKLENY